MELQDLEIRIAKVRRAVKNINLGGCGVFAYELYKILRSEFGIETEIRFAGYKSGTTIRLDHVFLRLKEGTPEHPDIFIDSNGIFYGSKDSFCATEDNMLDPLEIEDLIGRKELWNKAFHYYFQDAEFKITSNENFLKKMMYIYISNREYEYRQH